jgi:transcriptional regulator of acetoin/glycerol metabolism
MVVSLKNEIDKLKEMVSTGANYDEDTLSSVLGKQKSHQNVHYTEIPLLNSSDDTVTEIRSSRPFSLEDSEREAIINSLERNGGSRKKAAVELGISERTLYRKLKEFNII